MEPRLKNQAPHRACWPCVSGGPGTGGQGSECLSYLTYSHFVKQASIVFHPGEGVQLFQASQPAAAMRTVFSSPASQVRLVPTISWA